MRKGYRSPTNGHLGVYTLCSGPDPSGPTPGERVIIVIYDNDDKIVRRLEQVRGDCIDPGYVDFFLSNKCRPSRHEYHIIDIDAAGEKKILATHTSPSEGYRWFQQNCPLWVQEHGVPEHTPA